MDSASRRVLFQDIKPYDVPSSLDDLHGPASGRLELPRGLYWGPDPVVDLDTVGGVAKAYQAVLREGLVSEQAALLNREVLLRAWGGLLLPERVRSLWEDQFPELAAA